VGLAALGWGWLRLGGFVRGAQTAEGRGADSRRAGRKAKGERRNPSGKIGTEKKA